ncbi:hypothetical protein IV102_10010 [bacterium]|nr:hypothetical protein [bacterium]
MDIQLPSGVWSGHYEQACSKYAQQATLEFADGLIRGDGADDIGLFSIEGEYRIDKGEVRMGWIKTYQGAHSVLYLGKLKGSNITGKWDISGWGGNFALAPAPQGRDLR